MDFLVKNDAFLPPFYKKQHFLKKFLHSASCKKQALILALEANSAVQHNSFPNCTFFSDFSLIFLEKIKKAHHGLCMKSVFTIVPIMGPLCFSLWLRLQ